MLKIREIVIAMNAFIRNYWCRLIVVILFPWAVNAQNNVSLTPVDYVNPQIDTHKSRWFYFSSACRPFGMVSLSPDMWVKGSWNSGYLYDSTEVRCFSHIHCWQISGIPVMPTTGDILGHEGMEAYKSKYTHDTEIVKPGYHKIFLDRYGIEVELTSTSRVGMHRYKFPEGDTANVLLDVGAFLGHGPMQSAAIRKISDKEAGGYAVMAPTHRRKKPLTVYYVIRFDRPVSRFGGWELVGETKQLVKKQALEGKDIGAYVQFDNLKSKPLLMKVAISYVSEEQARLNLKTELDHWDFDRVVKDSYADWNRELGKITVEGGTEKEKIKFYTDLWHALLGRHTFSDANGKFVDNTGEKPVVRQVPLVNGKPVRNTYNSDSFWGSEFNLNILWSMAYPKVMSEFVSTLVDYYHTGGLIARGPSGGNYTYVMVGDQAVPLIAAAYNKGIRDFDIDAALEGSIKNAEPGGIRDHAGYEVETNTYMTHYVAKGFVPEGIPGNGGHKEGCAMTLYFAYQDWCLSQFAKGLENDTVYRKYYNRSFNYRYMFDYQAGWMHPRTLDGSWLRDFAPVGKGFNMPGFVESNAAIFTYYVPHNIPDLIYLTGGQDSFVNKLNRQFELAAPDNFITPHGEHAQNWVDYENQPSLHMAHLFSYAGAPWLTQYWVRRIKKDVFGEITPYGGYNGDEDQGQMGALGVLMAIGLFDVQGGGSTEPHYEITSPVFNKITIQLDNRYYHGKEFVIETKNNSAENVYIQSVKLNGQSWNSFRFPHSEFVKGGKLEIEMGAQPNKSWGSESIESQNKQHIVANPLNLNYRFMTNDPSRREAADPVLEYFKGKYYLFASKSGGYWSSPDLFEWTYIPCKSITTIEAYAPTILDYNDEIYFLASGGKPQIFKTKNPDQDSWEAIDTKFDIGMTDPAFFKDDNGDIYLYWGCSDVDPIMGAKVDPEDGFKVIGEPKILITHNEDKYGWEVQGENNELNKPGWNEGPCMIKYKGKYYLQYASPGTQFRIYGDGIYISDHPLGPFTYTENNPFCFKPGGFIGGSGHGHTFQDKYGNYWHVATMKVSVREWFERRIGLFPVYLADDDNMYSHTVLTDYPFYVPDKKIDFEKEDCSMNWNLLSYGKKVSSSSSLPGYEAKNANDERVESWWASRSGSPGEWWQVDLSKPMEVNAIQVNLADHNFTLKTPESYCYQYVVEYSPDGNNWKTLIDRSSNSKDMPHELVVLDKSFTTRYVRIKNTKDIPGSFSLYDFRVFGNGLGKLPQRVKNVNVKRDGSDKRIFRLSWNADDQATGYIVRWGVDKNHMNNAMMVYTNAFEGRFFNRDSEYFFTVDSFNENGCSSPHRTPADEVNPFIGATTDKKSAGGEESHGGGKTFPGAATPFGLVQLSPNTITGGDNGSGYSYEHTTIEGFAFTQMSGIGWYGDLGNFLVMPTTGDLKTSAGTPENPEKGYRSRYSKQSEKASAGYYEVVLSDYDIKTEIAAAPHSGILRFSFPENETARIQIDLARRVGGTSTMQYIKQVDDHTIQGWMKCPPEGGGWGNGDGKADYTVYFYAQFDRPFTRTGIWSCDIPDGQSRKREDVTSSAYQKMVANARVFENAKEMEGKHLGFYTEFATTKDEQVLMKAGISFVSMDGAQKNLKAEIKDWNFDRVCENTKNLWNDALSKVIVEGGTDEERTVFYTALYHTMIDPRDFSDVDGKYPGGDGHIHQTADFTKRTIFSGWDVFRSQFPLQTIINPAIVNDMINSLVTLAEESGHDYLERWEFLNAYSGCMVGNPAISVIADAYAKGIQKYDVNKAYLYARQTTEKFGNGDKGYSNGLSNTLEHAYTEWCMSQLAHSLGKTDDETKYARHAQSYRNVFDPSVGWFRSKQPDGEWMTWPEGGRLAHGYGCVESNPYQQGWFVPHDVPGLVELLGGKDNAIEELDSFFEKTPENMMWNDYYNHANEPVHHVPFLFNRMGAPWLTQKWTREICSRAYHNAVGGLVGNEDVGQMSAWYVLAAAGFHPLCPGDTRMEITSPVFRKITFRLDPEYHQGKDFVIEARNNTPENRYIQKAELNGQPYNKCHIDYHDIAKGGKLVLYMGQEPNKNWGVEP